MRFFNFFLNYMPQEYQNENSPILNGQKKPRTWGKVQKIMDLEGVGLFHPFENTLYIARHTDLMSFSKCYYQVPIEYGN